MKRRQRGFSLLEAIVALVIFSITVAALFEWQHVSLLALDRARAHARRDSLVRSGLSVIEHVNPMREPSGERTIGDLRVDWSAKPIRPKTIGKTPAGFPSLFDLALYDVTVRVFERGRELTSFDVRRVGYEQARSSKDL